MIDTVKSNKGIDFKNQKDVINFLKSKFSKKRYIKGKKILWQLILINNYYPLIIGDVVINLNKLTCWKSYFSLLLIINKQKVRLCENEQKEFTNINNNDINEIKRNKNLIHPKIFLSNLTSLENKIYDILIQQYHKDMELFENGKYKQVINQENIREFENNDSEYISTLVKWLPSKRSVLNKKLKFTKRFTDNVFCSKPQTIRVSEYNKLNKKLKQIIGICDREFSDWRINSENKEINFNKLSRLSIARHIKEINASPELQKQYLEYLELKFDSYNLLKIINLLGYINKLDKFSKIALNTIWNKNYLKYDNELNEYYGINLENDKLVIVDLSREIVNHKEKTKIIFAIIILASKMQIPVQIIGSDKNINFKDCSDLISMCQKIISCIGPCNQDNIFNEQIGKQKSIIIVNKLTNKEINKHIVPGSFIFEFEYSGVKTNCNKSMLISRSMCSKFNKIQGICVEKQVKLIDQILQKYIKNVWWEDILSVYILPNLVILAILFFLCVGIIFIAFMYFVYNIPIY